MARARARRVGVRKDSKVTAIIVESPDIVQNGALKRAKGE